MTNTTVQLPGWVMMWLTAILVFAGLKGMTALDTEGRIGAGYFFVWPGLDPVPFVGRRKRPGAKNGWLRGAILALCGAALSIMATRVAPGHPEVLVAIGIPMFLHFGVFDVLAWMWRRHGVGVRPIMERPLEAGTLTEFWSRWNTAVRDVSSRYVFRPVRRRTGMATAVMATFGVSGVVHDLVLSVPARGGYGLPTLYFLIQGLWMLIERRVKLGRMMGRAWMLVILVCPLPLLVHHAFRVNVLVPFAHALGRLWPC